MSSSCNTTRIAGSFSRLKNVTGIESAALTKRGEGLVSGFQSPDTMPTDTWKTCSTPVAYLLKRSDSDLPVCRNKWFFRFVCLLKPRLHTWHLNGHDPLCTYMCDFKSPGVGNDLEHRAHL